MKKLKIGVIGCGIISPIHLDAIKKNNNAELVMVCDIDLKRAIEKAEKYNCDYTDDLSTIINHQDIDVIHVLTPHFNHYSIAKAILNANKNCLLEKPMTINTDDAKDLINITKTNKSVKLGILFQNRLNTTSLYIKKIIDDHRYGKLKGIKATLTWLRDKEYYLHDSWRGKWQSEGGGVLINQAIHTLDLLQWFAGEITTISGSYGTYILADIIEVEDTAFMYLNFKNKVRGMLFVSNNNLTNSPVEIELVFDEGIVMLIDSKLYIKKDQEQVLLCEDITSDGEKAYWGLGHEKLINNFYQSIIDNSDNYINANEGAQTIEILEKFYKYANKEKNIKVENAKEW